MRVPEYFLFDPFEDYLHPPMQGYRLNRGKYTSIRPVDGRLPSKVLGLHLFRQGKELRFFDPIQAIVLPTPLEQNEELRREVEKLRRLLEEKQ